MQVKFKWVCLLLIVFTLLYLAYTNRYIILKTEDLSYVLKYDRWTHSVVFQSMFPK